MFRCEDTVISPCGGEKNESAFLAGLLLNTEQAEAVNLLRTLPLQVLCFSQERLRWNIFPVGHLKDFTWQINEML